MFSLAGDVIVEVDIRIFLIGKEECKIFRIKKIRKTIYNFTHGKSTLLSQE